MNAHAGVRLITRALAGVVLAVSGGYLMIYLYRWEWNRAVISGIFFIAAELALVTSSLFARLSRLEHDVCEASPVPPTPSEPEVDVERESPFAWLNPADGRMGVFVPLLMGAGVIVSAVAFVVEKLAGAVTRNSARRRGLAAVGHTLPMGGFFGDAEPPPVVAGPGRHPGSSTLARILLFVVTLALFPAIGLVADATQSRPDPHPDLTTVELDVWVRDNRESATEEATALSVSCQGGVRLDRVEVNASAPGRARLVVSGVMGEHARRKFTGCLQDAILDRVRADVVAVSTRPFVPTSQG